MIDSPTDYVFSMIYMIPTSRSTSGEKYLVLICDKKRRRNLKEFFFGYFLLVLLVNDDTRPNNQLLSGMK
jgi:hypothetical protein